MAKFTKKTKKNSDAKVTIIVIAFAVLVVVALVLLVLLSRGGQQPEPAAQTESTAATISTELPTAPVQEDAFPFEIPGFTRIKDVPEVIVDEQLSVLGVGSYSGLYFEDDSNETVENVLAIVVENIREDWVENADLTLSCGEETAQFSVTALPGHRCAILLEQNRMTYADDMTLGSPVCTFCTNNMDGKIVDFSADFSLEPYEGDVLVFRNISGHDFSGDAVLYYKSVAPYGKEGELLFIGGAAYACRFNGPIAAGEMRQATPAHYTVGGSAILFMTYES